ncbi:sporulation protein YpjB [Paenibacillus bouchesdurhonensis]|uniref:sporulation protein YpjB n=1 Tax=Paenibacillus bouchesdurhonensis TaxID=1870990 RepID=UPI001F2E3B8E|nr:sporulation protein YpjB [Paenibacillus bouchesdurhonensis]
MRGKNRRALLVLLSVLLFVGWTVQLPGMVAAMGTDSAVLSAKERDERLRSFEAVTERLYNAMQQMDTSTVHREMDQLIQALEGLSFKGLTSVDGIHALAECIIDTRESINRVKLSPEAWMETSARLRLAVNSLTHKQDALWRQYYKVMSSSLQDMGKARSGGNRTEFKEALQSLQANYDLIRPAAIIQREPWDIHKFDSWLSYIARVGSEASWDEAALKEAINQGAPLLQELFGRKGHEPVFMPLIGSGSPWYWSGLIGGWIMLALTYTGMRKYQAEQAVSSVRRPKGNGGLFNKRE